MGFYYSGALDWTFNPNPIKDLISFLTNGSTDFKYLEYANNHWYELIDKYEPRILWNDIGYPPDTNINEIFAHFYNKFSDGVVNDRWMQVSKGFRKIVKFRPIGALINWIVKRALKKGSASLPGNFHYDFRTPEYSSFSKILEDKWEACRGIGNSFAYNKFEKDEDYLTADELIRMLIDIVSKNGNLLINVGPMADGTIPEIQKKCLLGLGKWLEVNGDCLFETRPWKRAEGKTVDDIDVRFTQKENALHVILLDNPEKEFVSIKSLSIDTNANIQLLGYEGSLEWKQEGETLTISLPKDLKAAPAHAFKINPKPME